MQSALGCLFILIFGIFLFIIGIFRFIAQVLFGGGSARRPNPWNTRNTQTNYNRSTNTETNNSSQSQQTHTEYTAGNAHHEFGNNGRNNGKIFQKNEGEYVDFEEV